MQEEEDQEDQEGRRVTFILEFCCPQTFLARLPRRCLSLGMSARMTRAFILGSRFANPKLRPFP